MECQRSHLVGSVYSTPYAAFPSHLGWQAQLDVLYSPTLQDRISDIQFTSLGTNPK